MLTARSTVFQSCRRPVAWFISSRNICFEEVCELYHWEYLPSLIKCGTWKSKSTLRRTSSQRSLGAEGFVRVSILLFWFLFDQHGHK